MAASIPLPLPFAEVVGDSACGCGETTLDEPLDHWCGWPGPCCVSPQGKPWKGAKNLNHLPICHESCWRRDAVAVIRKMHGEGKEVNSNNHLRLCHRRCYVNDFVRNQTWQLTGEVVSPEQRKEIVPCNQVASELLGWPRFQHWFARWWLRSTGDRWQVPRDDFPWPEWWTADERRVLRMGDEREREEDEGSRRGD